MAPNESKRLQPGDRVEYLQDGLPVDHGTVLVNNKHAVQIQWDDVEGSGCIDGIGWIDHNDAKVLTKETHQ